GRPIRTRRGCAARLKAIPRIPAARPLPTRCSLSKSCRLLPRKTIAAASGTTISSFRRYRNTCWLVRRRHGWNPIAGCRRGRGNTGIPERELSRSCQVRQQDVVLQARLALERDQRFVRTDGRVIDNPAQRQRPGELVVDLGPEDSIDKGIGRRIGRGRREAGAEIKAVVDGGLIDHEASRRPERDPELGPSSVGEKRQQSG